MEMNAETRKAHAELHTLTAFDLVRAAEAYGSGSQLLAAPSGTDHPAAEVLLDARDNLIQYVEDHGRFPLNPDEIEEIVPDWVDRSRTCDVWQAFVDLEAYDTLHAASFHGYGTDVAEDVLRRVAKDIIINLVRDYGSAEEN